MEQGYSTQCGVCHEGLMIEPVTLKCKHRFDLMCIKQFYDPRQTEFNQKCPVCKAHYSLENFGLDSEYQAWLYREDKQAFIKHYTSQRKQKKLSNNDVPACVEMHIFGPQAQFDLIQKQQQNFKMPNDIVGLLLNSCNTFIAANRMPMTNAKRTTYLTAYELIDIALRVQTKYKEATELSGINYEYGNTVSRMQDDQIRQLMNEELPGNKYNNVRHNLPLIFKFNPFSAIDGIKWNDLRIPKQSFGLLTQQQGIQMIKFIQFLRGDFSDIQRVYLGKICFCDAFYYMHAQRIITFLVRPKRIPLVSQDDEGKPKLLGFKFIQYLEFYVFKEKEKMHLTDKLREIIYKVYEDHDQYACFLPDYVLSHLPKEKRQRAAFEKFESIVKMQHDKIYNQDLCCPKDFKAQMLNEEFASRYQLIEGRWTYKEEFEQMVDKFKRADEALMDVVQDEKGAAQLLRLIKSIPQLRFNLTPEQEKMIGTPSNLLCLGRSGTGKTTSSALRLFSTDAFYKYIEELQKFKKNNPGQGVSSFMVNPQFMNNQSTLKLVFVTASPVLTNEVRKFYNEMKSHFASELTKRRERKKKKEEKEESKEGEEDFENVEAETSKDTSIQDEQKEAFDAYVQLETDALADDEEIEKQLNIPSTMEDLTSDHFPLFVTVKRLIYMLDSSLEYSFFSRSSDGQIVGMDKNVEWHNESKGVFMINNYFKQKKDYDDKIRKLGKKLIHMDEEYEGADEHFAEELSDDEYEELADSQDGFNASSGLGSMINSTGNAYRFNLINRQLSFEVDFETFKNRFWPKVANWSKLSPLVVWTEIYSVIKGGADCFRYEYCVIPLYMYAEHQRERKKASAQFLTTLEKYQIYQIFMNYEKWKSKMNAYDFNDVVNHIIRQTRAGFKPSQMIHFLMVDEVQDLTPNLLRLLTSMTDRNVFFCGDTAQTIAKGVGFRFYDLKRVFSQSENFQVPSVIQLSKNFRSHSKILDLANSVVSLIELFFPKTIDKLLKESSDLDGPRPIFIDPATGDQLPKMLLKRTFANITQGDMSAQQIEGSALNKPQFGCNQVIIVRDQESKSRIPIFLSNMLCLTVYEAKGLEFDDVILFNFFEDSKCGNQWMLIKDVDFMMTVVKKCKEFDFIRFEDLDIDEEEQDQLPAKDNTTQIIVNENEEIHTQLILKKQRGEVYRSFAQLCTELKFLYVAITRPKKVLIIYDEDNRFRKPLQEMWAKMSLVDVVTKEMLADHSLLKVEVSNVLHSDLGQAMKTTQEEWRFNGIMLFKKKFYQSAIQCFQNAGDKDLELRCLAYQYADRASLLLGESSSKILQSKNKSFPRSERNQMKTESKDLKKEAFKDLDIAGGYFNQIGMIRHSAQCYCTAQKFEKAAQMFEMFGDFGQAAECFLKVGNTHKASDLYAKAGLFANAFESYERMQDWEGLLMCLSKNKESFKKEERDSLIEKYFPIALNSLYELYANFNPLAANIGMGEDNKGKLQEMRIKLKFQKSISVIQENVDEEISDEEQEEEEESKIEETEQTISQQDSQSQQQEQESKADQSEDYEIIDTSIKSKKKEKKQNLRKFLIEEVEDEVEEIKEEDNVEIIEEEESKDDGDEIEEGDEKKKTGKASQNSSLQFEILSSVDPEDEFLKNDRSVSLIDSIVSQSEESFSIISGGQSSEFSLVQDSKLHSIIMSVYSGMSQEEQAKAQSEKNQSIELDSDVSALSGVQSVKSLMSSCRFSTISNDRDEYAEDIVMQKVIFYISLFSEDVSGRLKEMRSKDSLGHLEMGGEFDSDFMIYDLDNISQELLYLILDTLEHYEMFRLCIIICNRYHLKEKVARYIVSIGNKYSNIKDSKFSFMQKFVKENVIESQRAYSLIAHEAMHNVLSIIEKDLLKIDTKGKDALQVRDLCFESLFLQGFWKKLVFFMDVDSSLQLTYAVEDIENFKILYLVYKCGIQDGEQIKQLLNEREGQDELHKLIANDVNKVSKMLAEEITMFQEANQFQSLLRFAFLPSHGLQQKGYQVTSSIKSLITKNANKIFNFQNKRDSYLLKKVACYAFKLVSTNYTQGKVLQKYLMTFTFDELQEMYKLVQNLLKIVLNKGSHHISFNKVNEIKRMAFNPFGVCFLQGLEIFQKFSDTYCLVKTDSPIIKVIAERQEQEMIKFKNEEIAKSLKNNLQQHAQDQVLRNVVLTQVAEIMKSIDENPRFNQKQMALLCDLNLKFCLAPIQWVEEILITQCVSFITVYYFYQLSFSEQLINSMGECSFSLTHYAQMLGLSNHLVTNLNEQARMIIKRKKHESSEISLQKKIIPYGRQILESLFTNQKEDMVSQRFNSSIAKINANFKSINTKLVGKANHVFSITQNIQKMPDDVKSSNDFYERTVLLDLAFSQAKLAFQQLGNNAKFYSLILQTFRSFIIADQYIYLMQLLRGQKKKVKKIGVKGSEAQKKIKLAQISNAYNLLDVHVYLKCNQWCPAIDSMYAFLNSTFNFISYSEITQILEGAFYRALFNFYIYRNKEKTGVLIPDYAMKNLDPKASYQSRAIHNKKDDISVNVTIVELHKVKIDMAKDIKLLSEAFYWANHLIEILNKDDEGYLQKRLYFKIYNMIVSMFVNSSSRELQQNLQVVERILKLFKLFRDSSVEKSFNMLYKVDSIEKVISFADSVMSKHEHKLFSALRTEKDQISGFVRVVMKDLYDKETGKILQNHMDKAYYQEQSILARHIAASNYICRIYTQQKQLQVKMKKAVNTFREEEIYHKQRTAIDVLQNIKEANKPLKQKVIREACYILSDFEDFCTQLMHMQQSKFIINSLDLHFMKHKFEMVCKRKHQLQKQLREMAYSNGQNEEIKASKYVPKHQQLMGSGKFDQLSDKLLQHRAFLETEKHAIAEWILQKAEPNLIEIEKKKLHLRNKWEGLIQFQKKKRVMLKHFAKNMKK